MESITTSEKETFALAKKFGEKLCGGDIVLLDGYLGAGKTAFTKGIASYFKISEDITSPTFTIMNEYFIPNSNEILCHIDAYRITSVAEAYEAGLCEYIGAADCITIIEWHENIKELLESRAVYRVAIETVSENEREIKFYDK